MIERVVRRGLRALNGSPSAPAPADNAYEWDRMLPSVGVDFAEERAMTLLRDVFPSYRSEFEHLPRTAPTNGHAAGFYLENGYFEAVDAEVLYCVVRHFRPQRVIEVGSGFSTLITRMALQANGGAATLMAIDPEPRTSILGAIDEHIPTAVEAVDPRVFSELKPNDVLFIDSSHVVRAGGDVNYLFFEVLARLSAGVLVHIHDIFLPYEYPPRWIEAGNTEQYLLLAFLTHSQAYEVLWPGHYMRMRHPHALEEVFASCRAATHPGSFWIRRSD